MKFKFQIIKERIIELCETISEEKIERRAEGKERGRKREVLAPRELTNYLTNYLTTRTQSVIMDDYEKNRENVT